MKKQSNQKELAIKMDFYLTMNVGETQEQALERFDNIIQSITESRADHESAYQIYDTRIIEY